MLIQLACIFSGMALGMALMLFISWLTNLRHEDISVWAHMKSMLHTVFNSPPEYWKQ